MTPPFGGVVSEPRAANAFNFFVVVTNCYNLVVVCCCGCCIICLRSCDRVDIGD